MMNRLMGRRAAHLIPLLLLAACGSGQQHTQRVLDQRLTDRLASEVASGQAVVQKTATGNRVTLLGQSAFSNGPRALDDQNRDVRADVIEGLLDPRLMRVQVADSSSLPEAQRGARVRNVSDYFAANGLGSVVVPADAPRDPAATDPAAPSGLAPPGLAPPGLALTIDVLCPPSDGRIGYGNGNARPVCD